jgi:hypothetical protein
MYVEEDGTELARLKFDNSMLIFNSMRKLQHHIYIPFDNSIDLSLLNEQILKQQEQYNWYDPHYDERYLAIFLPISGGGIINYDKTICQSFRYEPDDETLELLDNILHTTSDRIILVFSILERYNLERILDTLIVDTCAISS